MAQESNIWEFIPNIWSFMVIKSYLTKNFSLALLSAWDISGGNIFPGHWKNIWHNWKLFDLHITFWPISNSHKINKLIWIVWVWHKLHVAHDSLHFTHCQENTQGYGCMVKEISFLKALKDVISTIYAFLMVAILVFQNKETVATLVYQVIPPVTKLYFLFEKFSLF